VRRVIWSPDIAAVDGQTIVTKFVLSSFSFDDTIFFQRGFGISAIRSWVSAAFRLHSLARKKASFQYYFVPSRTFFGVIRDIPAYLFFCNSRVIVHLHGSEFISLLNNFFFAYLFSRLVDRNDVYVVTPSRYQATLISSKLGSRATTRCIENPFLLQILSDCTESSANHDGSCYRILWNSNLMEEKGYLVFAEALTMLPDSVWKRLRVTVCGRVTGGTGFKRAVQDLHARLSRFPFNYEGVVDRDRISYLVNRCQCVILPSHYKTECQPLAVIEAMLFGRDLIISDLSALQETVGSYPCKIVRQRSVEDLVSSISLLASEDHRPMASGSDIDGAVHRFSVPRFVKSLSSVLG
jgi:glycosyltransferase involved in cell wall biosynthesis